VVPEQHLQETEMRDLAEGFDLIAGTRAEIGVLQGIVTMPLRADDLLPLDWVMGFDQDPSPGIVDFTGEVNPCRDPWYCRSLQGSLSPFVGTGDGHRGIDYGTLEDTRGVPFFASHSGHVLVFEGSNVIDGQRALCLAVSQDDSWAFGRSSGLTTSYQHADNIAVRNGDFVHRGQFLGYVGDTGGGWVHLHFEAWHGESIEYGEFADFYNKDFYAMLDQDLIIPGFNDLSIWTEWNSPHYPLVSMSYAPSFSYYPTPTPMPSTDLSLSIDGFDSDWSGQSPILTDRSGDSTIGNLSDLVSVFLATDENYLFLMINAEDGFSLTESQLDIRFDIKPGRQCDESEIGITIQQEALPSYWDSGPCISGQNPLPISGAQFEWADVVELRIPLSIFGDYEYLTPIIVHLNMKGPDGWFTADRIND
jgi:murein DD-endopeptidase MepM/ murein hydrolase activator NlpD